MDVRFVYGMSAEWESESKIKFLTREFFPKVKIHRISKIAMDSFTLPYHSLVLLLILTRCWQTYLLISRAPPLSKPNDTIPHHNNNTSRQHQLLNMVAPNPQSVTDTIVSNIASPL